MDFNNIVSTVQSNLVPIAIGCVGIVIGVKLLKGLFRIGLFVIAGLFIAHGLGVF